MTHSTSWTITNNIFACALVLAALVWLIQFHTFGVSIGLVGFCITYFLFKRNRWAYFAAAIWFFGLLRIAMDDGYAFHGDYGSYVKLPYVFGIVLAIVLHEKVAIKSKLGKGEDGDEKNMPN